MLDPMHMLHAPHTYVPHMCPQVLLSSSWVRDLPDQCQGTEACVSRGSESGPETLTKCFLSTPHCPYQPPLEFIYA